MTQTSFERYAQRGHRQTVRLQQMQRVVLPSLHARSRASLRTQCWIALRHYHYYRALALVLQKPN